MAEHKPLGHRLIEGGWGWSLIRNEGPALEASDYLYTRLFDGLRIMYKLEEADKFPDRHAEVMRMVGRAHDLGLKIQLSIDWFNTARRKGDYHRYRYFPNNLGAALRQAIRDCDPHEIEVCNEPMHCKTASGGYPKRMTTAQYAGLVREYVEAFRATGWNGLMLAWQTQDGNDVPSGWEWRPNCDWHHSAEVRHDFVLDPRSEDPAEFEDEIKDAMDNPRRWAVGWRWPIFQNEHSSVGTQIHINTQHAAQMCEASFRAYRDERCPWGWLTVGGQTPNFGNEGGWGMHTDLINDEGEFSLGCQRLMNLFGVDIPDIGNGGGNGGSPPPSTGGIRDIEKAQEKLARSHRNWRSNNTQARKQASRAKDHIDDALES